MNAMRAAQKKWAVVPIKDRLHPLRKLRALIGGHAESLAASSATARDRPMAESLTAEVLPLAEACRFLERNAAKILRTKKFGALGRPLWLGGVASEIRRDALGVILVIGPGNYPLFLPGVQLIQGLIAGNAVMLKPGVGGYQAAAALVDLIGQAGFDTQLIELLSESIDEVKPAIDAGPDKVIFTGSAEVGRIISKQLSEKMIPGVFELSGCDAVIVRCDADLDLVEKALRFGLELNAGATCMVPQRLFVHRSINANFVSRFENLTARVFHNDEEIVSAVNGHEFGLGASIFSRDETAAGALAQKLEVGLVTINDIIVSSADARLPFGGRRGSGYGSTRGAEGLLALTVPKSITVSRSKFRPAYRPMAPGDLKFLLRYARLSHGCGLRERFGSFFSKSSSL